MSNCSARSWLYVGSRWRLRGDAIGARQLCFPHPESESLSYLSSLCKELVILKTLLQLLERLIAGYAPKLDARGGDGLTHPGAAIFDLLGQLNINFETYATVLEQLDAAAEALASGHRGKSSGEQLSELANGLRLIFASAEYDDAGRMRPDGVHTHYRMHVARASPDFTPREPRRPPAAGGASGAFKPPQVVVSYWCFNSGIALAALAKLQVRSMLITSGTLAPLESFASELGLPFPLRLENPHVVTREQVWAGTIAVGPTGRPLNSSFRHRDSPESVAEMGAALANFVRCVPDGVLVFFPSYAAMASSLSAWKAPPATGGPSLWDRITERKLAVEEPREAALFPAVLADFNRKLADPAAHGAVFFAVCRGKVSEGLDFADAAGRAVVVTGIPYASFGDPRVRIKREILDAAAARAPRGSPKPLTGEAWYSQQAVRAINQALGRVLRHKDDYGAVLLCDERMASSSVQGQLSRWLRPSVTQYATFGAAQASLAAFFRPRIAQRAALLAAKQGDAFEPSVPGHRPAEAAGPTVGAGGDDAPLPAASAGLCMPDAMASALVGGRLIAGIIGGGVNIFGATLHTAPSAHGPSPPPRRGPFITSAAANATAPVAQPPTNLLAMLGPPACAAASGSQQPTGGGGDVLALLSAHRAAQPPVPLAPAISRKPLSMPPPPPRPAVVPLPPVTAGDFIAQAKTAMGPDWPAFKAQLQAVKEKRVAVDALIEQVFDQLGRPGRSHLLSGFATFVPSADRDAFRKRAREVVDRLGGAKRPR